MPRVRWVSCSRIRASCRLLTPERSPSTIRNIVAALRAHEGRHTYASIAVAAGLNAKTLSTYPGHATITITLDRYGHLMPGSEVEARAMLDAYLNGSGD